MSLTRSGSVALSTRSAARASSACRRFRSASSWTSRALTIGAIEHGLQLGLLGVEVLDGGIRSAIDLDDGDAQIVFGFARDFDLAASFENDSSIKAIARAFQRACQHNGVSVVRRQ
jgi:hypothetical protein